MEEKVASGLREQQARRKRVNRLKMFMVVGVVIWILVLTVLIATLLVKVFFLEEKLNEAAGGTNCGKCTRRRGGS